MRAKHRTIKLKQEIKAPLEKVFKALSSTRDKAKWSAPKGDKIVFTKSDFRVGGVEKFKCGPVGSLDYQGTLHYEDIVDGERIVYTETVFYKKEKLASALVTTELTRGKVTTVVHMTIQVASYCGDQMLKGSESGYRSALENLNQYLKTVNTTL